MIAIIIAVIGLIIAVLTASEFKSIAEEKGFEGKKYFWWCFWLLPIGSMMVIALPDRNATQPTSKSSNSNTRNVAQSYTPSPAPTQKSLYDDLPEI